MRERQQQQNAQQRLDARRADRESLQAEIDEHGRQIDEKFSPEGLALEEVSVKPLKKDSRVEPVAVVWERSEVRGRGNDEARNPKLL